MHTVIVSSKYQVTIPIAVREALGIKAGQLIHIVLYEGRVQLIPIIETGEARGFLKGIDSIVRREADRR